MDPSLHEDGVQSMLHMRCAVRGDRVLHVQAVPGDIKADDERVIDPSKPHDEDLKLEQKEGSCYVSSPALFWHRVEYVQPTIAIQFRSAVFFGRRSNYDKIMTDVVAPIVKRAFAKFGFTLPSEESVETIRKDLEAKYEKEEGKASKKKLPVLRLPGSDLRGPRHGTGQGLFTGGVNDSGSWKVPSVDSRKVLKTFRQVLRTFRKLSGGFRSESGACFREQPVKNETNRVSAGLAVHRLFTEASGRF